MTLQSAAAHLPPDAPPGPWFHNLSLPDGAGGVLHTAPDHPLGDFPRFKWEAIEPHLPADLSGAHALDVGCNAGFYAIELARRGAAVTAIDHDPRYLEQARWAAGRLAEAGALPANPPRFRQGSVYDLARPTPDEPERFDVVWFMGVLYHLRYPLLALDLLADRTAPGGLMVFQTLTLPEDDSNAKAPRGLGVKDPSNVRIGERAALRAPGWPTLAFIERDFEDDPTNWFLADAPACRAMLRSAGFEIAAEIPEQEVFLCRRRSDGDDNDRLRDEECRAATGRLDRPGETAGSLSDLSSGSPSAWSVTEESNE
ncbi:DUF1698 domain-containing protein [Alienimonas californiensis]|uniref:tRNA (Mo5U34)-methyltransferase n=1 Tax=Alienimonas californiensis TaxID=2527989 RepID=A0A517P5Q2_9PLAN|nr:DUF1698 domain-containing protein [Alienimonas californiensis]QDT14702.1 tRNA (mo5U34)-methyltransferase [Alienimonas californiensis]